MRQMNRRSHIYHVGSEHRFRDQRVPLYGNGAFGIFLITARDGHLFRCSVELVRHSPAQRRWVLEDAAEDYVGPAYQPLDYLEDLVPIVSDWWELARPATAHPRVEPR